MRKNSSGEKRYIIEIVRSELLMLGSNTVGECYESKKGRSL